MSRAPGIQTWAAGVAMVAGLAFAGWVAAQPASPPQATGPASSQAPVIPGAPPEESPPAAAEEAPPAVVPPPAPAVAPPIQAAEVAPAAPPQAQVAEKPTETTEKRARYDAAIIQALDKISARSIRFKAEVGKPVRYKNLVFTVRACERAGADEAADDSIAYMTIHAQPRLEPGKPAQPARRAFQGWMYASSPGLDPLEHPVYDAWLITCVASKPPAVASR